MKMMKLMMVTVLTTVFIIGAFMESADAIRRRRAMGDGSSNNNRNLEFELDIDNPGKIFNIKFLDKPNNNRRKILGIQSEVRVNSDLIIVKEESNSTQRISPTEAESIPGQVEEPNSDKTIIAKWIEYKADLNFRKVKAPNNFTGKLTMYLPLCDPSICSNSTNDEDVVFPYEDFSDGINRPVLFYKSKLTEEPDELLDIANLADRSSLPPFFDGKSGFPLPLTGILDVKGIELEPDVPRCEFDCDVPSEYGLPDTRVDDLGEEPFGLGGNGISIKITSSRTVSEPSATASLLALGVLGLGSVLKYRSKLTKNQKRSRLLN